MTSTPRAHSLGRGGRRRNAAPPDSGCATWWQVLEIAGNRGAICVGQPARAVLDHLAHGVAEEVAVGGHAAFQRIGDVGVVPVGQAAGSWREVRHLTAVGAPRSEEHTSELQSLMRISYAVFCLKKKNEAWYCATRL